MEVSWVQTNIKFETFKANFDNCQERVDMSSRVQKELESRIKKHVMLESELAKAKAREKAIKNSKLKRLTC